MNRLLAVRAVLAALAVAAPGAMGQDVSAACEAAFMTAVMRTPFGQMDQQCPKRCSDDGSDGMRRCSPGEEERGPTSCGTAACGAYLATLTPASMAATIATLKAAITAPPCNGIGPDGFTVDHPYMQPSMLNWLMYNIGSQCGNAAAVAAFAPAPGTCAHSIDKFFGVFDKCPQQCRSAEEDDEKKIFLPVCSPGQDERSFASCGRNAVCSAAIGEASAIGIDTVVAGIRDCATGGNPMFAGAAAVPQYQSASYLGFALTNLADTCGAVSSLAPGFTPVRTADPAWEAMAAQQQSQSSQGDGMSGCEPLACREDGAYDNDCCGWTSSVECIPGYTLEFRPGNGCLNTFPYAGNTCCRPNPGTAPAPPQPSVDEEDTAEDKALNQCMADAACLSQASAAVCLATVAATQDEDRFNHDEAYAAQFVAANPCFKTIVDCVCKNCGLHLPANAPSFASGAICGAQMTALSNPAVPKQLCEDYDFNPASYSPQFNICPLWKAAMSGGVSCSTRFNQICPAVSFFGDGKPVTITMAEGCPENCGGGAPASAAAGSSSDEDPPTPQELAWEACASKAVCQGTPWTSLSTTCDAAGATAITENPTGQWATDPNYVISSMNSLPCLQTLVSCACTYCPSQVAGVWPVAGAVCASAGAPAPAPAPVLQPKTLPPIPPPPPITEYIWGGSVEYGFADSSCTAGAIEWPDASQYRRRGRRGAGATGVWRKLADLAGGVQAVTEVFGGERRERSIGSKLVGRQRRQDPTAAQLQSMMADCAGLQDIYPQLAALGDSEGMPDMGILAQICSIIQQPRCAANGFIAMSMGQIQPFCATFAGGAASAGAASSGGATQSCVERVGAPGGACDVSACPMVETASNDPRWGTDFGYVYGMMDQVPCVKRAVNCVCRSCSSDPALTGWPVKDQACKAAVPTPCLDQLEATGGGECLMASPCPGFLELTELGPWTDSTRFVTDVINAAPCAKYIVDCYCTKCRADLNMVWDVAGTACAEAQGMVAKGPAPEKPAPKAVYPAKLAGQSCQQMFDSDGTEVWFFIGRIPFATGGYCYSAKSASNTNPEAQCEQALSQLKLQTQTLGVVDYNPETVQNVDCESGYPGQCIVGQTPEGYPTYTRITFAASKAVATAASAIEVEAGATLDQAIAQIQETSGQANAESLVNTGGGATGGVKSLFQEADVDGDGALSASEAAEFVRLTQVAAMGLTSTADEVAADLVNMTKTTAAAAAAVGTEKVAALEEYANQMKGNAAPQTVAEAQQVIQQQTGLQLSTELMEKADADGNGELSAAEFQVLVLGFSQAQEQVQQEKIATGIKKLDADEAAAVNSAAGKQGIQTLQDEAAGRCTGSQCNAAVVTKAKKSDYATVAKAINAHVPGLTLTAADAQQADADGDGEIDFTEYMNLLAGVEKAPAQQAAASNAPPPAAASSKKGGNTTVIIVVVVLVALLLVGVIVAVVMRGGGSKAEASPGMPMQMQNRQASNPAYADPGPSRGLAVTSGNAKTGDDVPF